MAQIIVDQLNLVIYARVSGFLDTQQLMQIAAEADDAVAGFGDRGRWHGRLYELTDAKVAPPEAIDALLALSRNPGRAHLRANRVAYFGATPLVELQIARLCVMPNAAMFTNRRDAYEWATGGRDKAALARVVSAAA
ncbi:hypothetical protein ACLB0R_12380 [Sphingomonas sp. GlSt437]|uniref:hypothetical protein n=1 Tax=Sphingomonas sp. GlSt437 TaxID=3389970 RepID=UPI003A8A43EB